MFVKRCIPILCIFALCLTLARPGIAEAGQNFENLSFMGGYFDRHPTPVRVWKPFFDAAKEKFPGKLSYNYFSYNTLYSEKESFAAITDGRADFGMVRASYFPGNMDLMTVLDLPGMAPNAIVGSLVAQELVEKFPEIRAEFPRNSVPFTAWASASYQFHTLKPAKTLADIIGKKIIVWDSTNMEVVKALGGNPVRMTSADTYLALSKAMADGVYCPIAPLRSMKITEVANYHIVANMGVVSFNMFVNKGLWDSMPKDMQTWLTANGGMKMAMEVGKSLEDSQIEDIKWMEDQGHTFYYPTAAERNEFIAPLQFFRENWVQACEKRGLKNVREILKFTEERSKYHTDQMLKGAYGNYKL